MLNKKIFYFVIIILIAVILIGLVGYGVFFRHWRFVFFQERPTPPPEQPSNEQTNDKMENQTEQESEQMESANNESKSPVEEKEGNNKENKEQNKEQNKELVICRDDCGDGICQMIVCTDDMNCPCLETPESCPQDCQE